MYKVDDNSNSTEMMEFFDGPYKSMADIAQVAANLKEPKKLKKFEYLFSNNKYLKDKQKSFNLIQPEFENYIQSGIKFDCFEPKYKEFINSFSVNVKEWGKHEIYFLLLSFYHKGLYLISTDILFRFLDSMSETQIEIFARVFSQLKNQDEIFDKITRHFGYYDSVTFNKIRICLYLNLVKVFKDKKVLASRIHSMASKFDQDIDQNRLFFYLVLILMVTDPRYFQNYESQGLFSILLKRDSRIYSSLKKNFPEIKSSCLYKFINSTSEYDFKELIQKNEYFDLFENKKSFRLILCERYGKGEINKSEKYDLLIELYEFIMGLNMDDSKQTTFKSNFYFYVQEDIIRSAYFSLYRPDLFNDKKDIEIRVYDSEIDKVYQHLVELELRFQNQSKKLTKEMFPVFFKITFYFIEKFHKEIKSTIPNYIKQPTLIHFLYFRLKIDQIKSDSELNLGPNFNSDIYSFTFDQTYHWEQQQKECLESFEILGQEYIKHYNHILESAPLNQKEHYNKLITAIKSLKSTKYSRYPVKTYEELLKEYNENKVKYENLYRAFQFVLEFGFKEFQKEIITYSVDPRGAYHRLKAHLTTTLSDKISYLLQSETIEIIETYIDSKLFKKVFDFYKNQGAKEIKNDLNNICAKSKMFIDKILTRTLSKEHTNLLFLLRETPTQDIKSIYEKSMFLLEKVMVEDVIKYFKQTVSLVSMKKDLKPFYKFIKKQSFMTISDFDEIKNNLEKLQVLLSGNQLENEDIEKTQEKVKQMLGGLTTLQIKLFSVINMDMIEFFSEFEDKQSFDDRTNLITTNLFSDHFSSSLIDSATIVYHCLSSIFKVYKEFKSKEPQVLVSFSLNQFCQSLLSTFPCVENLDNTFNNLESIRSNMGSLRSLYAFEHGTSTFKKICDILSKSEFHSRYAGEDGWFIKLNGIDYKSEKLKDWEYGLKLRDISDEQKDTLTRYQNLLAQLEEIHKTHTELDQLFTPEYFGICIKISIETYSQEKIKEECDKYKNIISIWRDKMKSFLPRIRLLRIQSISSLYLSIKQILNNREGKQELVLKKSIAKTLVSFVKFCYSNSKIPITQEYIESSIININIGLAVHDYINKAFNEFEKVFQEPSSSFTETGPNLIYIKTKEQIYLSMVELNGSGFPHSNQIFFGHKINQEIDDLFYLLETFCDRAFFLIGFPDNCQKLLHRLSFYYNDHRFDHLSRFYIISTTQNSAFEFIDKTEYQCEYKWENIKPYWKHQSRDLFLVSGPSGSGKSFFIAKEKPNKLTLLIHPNTNYSQLVQGVMSKIYCPNNPTRELCIHVIMTPYEDKHFNSFIYHLIMFGIIMNEQNGELIDIGHIFSKLIIYVEIGQPMNDFIPASLKINFNLALECQYYAKEFIPLIFNLADNIVYSSEWKINEKLEKCLLYYYDQTFHKKVPQSKLSTLTVLQYMEHITKIVDGKYNLDYLSNPSCLQYRNNFFSLLSERLDFLARCISLYDAMVRTGIEVASPEELYKKFILEAVALADPKLYSVDAIWENPPALTTRTIINHETSNKRKLEVPFLHAIDLNEKSFQMFMSTVSQAFGIESHTYIIENLSQLYNYILTPEFTLRIVILHEKIKNQKSLILTGDTGTGKTHILKFYSLLINARNNSLTEIFFELQEFANKIISTTGKESKLNIIDIQKMAETNTLLTANTDSTPDGCFSQMSDDHSSHFKVVEEFIQKTLKKHKLIDLQTGSLLMAIDKSSSPIITTNQLLNEALKELVNVKFKTLFYRIIMHQKYNSAMFKDKVNIFQNKAMDLRLIDQSLKLVVFIDEFNTSPNDTMALINELFTDGTLDGMPLRVDNIVWIGAMNPKSLCKNPIDYTGTESSTMKDEFLVNDPPPSMNQLYFNFGEFNVSSEEKFIEGLLRNYQEPYSTHLKEAIMIGQNQLRVAKQSRIHVSMRDIVRAIDLYTFFIKNSCGQSLVTCGSNINMNEKQKHWVSLILSMSLTYYIRFIPGPDRDKMAKEFQFFLDRKVEIFDSTFLQIFKDRYLSLCKYTTLPTGVALTESLMLNIFCTVVSINCGIPLCIVGPPGCSKTLSFTIVIDNMNKADKSQPYCFMPEGKPFRYQCTPHTTDNEVKSKFKQAINRQRAIQSNLSTCVLFLDEASLIDEEKSPLKVMHKYLDKFTKRDDPKDNIGIIILSNKILDAAKTNRAMLLIHPETITNEDERSLVMGCLFNKTDKESLDEKEKKIVSRLCRSYEKVNKYAPKGFFHQRDFVYFLKQLNKEHFQKRIDLPLALLNCLERNFGGIPHSNFKELAKEFFEYLRLNPPASLETNNTIDALKRSLSEDLDDAQKPSDIIFRYSMLIDPSNESSLHILKEVGIEHTIVRVGGFGNDKSEESLVQVLSLIKSKMATETTLVLVNTEVIDPCFYELFNRYFILMPSREANAKTMYLSNVSFGTHSIHFEVHPKFKVLIHMPLSRIGQVQTPWINRFEKYYLSIDALTQFKNTGFEKSTIDRFDFLLHSSQDFVEKIHISQSQEFLLTGFSKTETIPSLVYSYSKTFQDTEKEFYPRKNNISEQTMFNYKLLQIARPEAIIKYNSFLPQHYLTEYFKNQEHFSIIQFLRKLYRNRFNNTAKRESNKWTIFTRNSPSLVSLKDIDTSLILDDLVDKENIQIENYQTRVIHLTMIQSSIECQTVLNSFKQSNTDQLLIVIVDSSIIDRNVVNYVFECLSDLHQSKLFVLIYGFPSEYSLLKQLQSNSIFLNGNDYMYIDSLGINDQHENNSSWCTQDIENKEAEEQRLKKIMAHDQKVLESKEIVFRSLINAACKIESIPKKEEIFKVFENIFLQNLSKISLSMNPYNHGFGGLTGRVLEFYTNSKKRTTMLLSLFKRNPIWMESVIESFINQFVMSFHFIKVLENISEGILYGKDSQSIIESFEGSLVSYVSPVTSNIVKILSSHHSIGRVLSISKKYRDNFYSDPKSMSIDPELDQNNNEDSLLTKDDIKELYQLVSLVIRSSDLPNLPTLNSIKKLEPITLPIHKADTNYQLPLYFYIETSLLNIINRVLAESGTNDIALNYCYLCFYIESHPIRQVLEYINSSKYLFGLFKLDFIRFRFNISSLSFGINDPNLCNFFIGLMDIIMPFKDDRKYSQILQYFIIQKYYLDIIKFIYNSIIPIKSLLDENSNFLIELLSDLSNISEVGDNLNIQDLKICLINFSVQKLTQFYNQKIKSRLLELGTMTKPTRESIIVWLRVAKDLFNRIKITEIVNYNINRFEIYYIHTIYQILVNIDIEDPQTMVFFSDTFTTNDPIKFYNQIKNYPISQECVLDIMQPILQNDPEYFLEFIKEPTTPLGWSCNLFKLIYTENASKFSSLINEHLEKNPDSFEYIGTPFSQCLDKISTLSQMIFTSSHSLSSITNGNLVDILFYSFYEMKKDDSNLCAQFKLIYQNKQSITPIQQIQFVVLNCVILDQLANQINNFDFKKIEEKIRGKEIQEIYKIILSPSLVDDPQTQVYKIYLFKKIINEKTLLTLLQSKELLECIGLSKHHISDTSIQLDDRFYMPFMYDQKCPEYFTYTQCLDIIERQSMDSFKQLIETVKNLHSSYKYISSLRMILFLLAYRFFMNGNDRNLLFIKKIIEDKDLIDALYLKNYIPHFSKIVNKEFNWENQIDELLFDRLSPHKSKEIQARAYCIINFIAISIGSANNHLSNLTTSPLTVILKDFPGCEGGILIDCSMRYRLHNKPIETESMGGIVLNKFLINAMTWCVIAFSASVHKYNYKDFNGVYEKKKFIHFPQDSTNASNYILSRGIASFGELSMSESYITRNIDPIMISTNISFKLWDLSFTDASIKSVFEGRESYNYETTFCKIIAQVEKEYEDKRKISNIIVSEKNLFLGTIIKIRLIISSFYPTPFISYETIYGLISREGANYPLLKLFMSKIKNICASSHFSSLINFLKMFFKFNSNIIPESYLKKGMKDIFEYLLTTHSETEESLAPFKNEFEQFKKSWAEVKSCLMSMEGCPRANSYEKEIPSFDDDTPVILFLSDKADKGYIISVITDWLDNTQADLISKCQQITQSSPFISSILHGFYDSEQGAKFDICDITPEFGTNYMLIGSNFSEDDFINFIKLEISKYQTQNSTTESQVTPKWSEIEKRLILNYISGRSIVGPAQFKEYNIDFPFNAKLAEYNDETNKNNNNSNNISNNNNNNNKNQKNNEMLMKPVGPQYFKDLITTCESLTKATGKIYKQKIGADKLKFRSYFKFKLFGNGLEILATYLVDTMIKLLNTEDDIKGKTICSKSNEGVLKIDKNIQTLLEITPIDRIISVSNILIKCNSGYKSFSNIIPEPVKVDKQVMESFKNISKKIQESCGNISQKIREWNDYLLDFIKANLENRLSISQVQPNYLLVKLFKDFKLTNISYGPNVTINIFSEIPTNTIASYYALFMDMLQDTLMNLYIKLDEEQTLTNVYKELKTPEKDIETLDLDKDNVPTYQKSNPLDEVKILSAEENKKNVNLKIVGRPLEPYRAITTEKVQCDPMIANLFNWLRFILSTSDYNSKIPSSLTFYTCLNTFVSECNHKTNNPLDVSELYKQMNIPNEAVLSSPSKTLTTILDRISCFFVNDHINSLVGLQLTHYCPDCNETTPSSYSYFTIPEITIDSNHEISSESLSKHITSHTNNFKKTLKKPCDSCDQDLTPSAKYPKYLFIDINRNIEGELKHDKFIHPSTIQILKSTFSLHSVLNIDGSFNIYKDENISFKPNSISIIKDKQESETIDQHHSRLLIYQLCSPIPKSTTTTPIVEENKVDDAMKNNQQQPQQQQQQLSSPTTPILQSGSHYEIWDGKSANDLRSTLNNHFILWINSKQYTNENKTLLVQLLEGSGILDFGTAFMLKSQVWQEIFGRNIGLRIKFLKDLEELKNQDSPQQGSILSPDNYVLK